MKRLRVHVNFNYYRILLSLLVVFVLLSPLAFTIQYLTDVYADVSERNSPTEDWYVYYDIKPVKASFERGETIAFNSFIEYRQDIEVSWEDTLYCKIKDDGIKKQATQFWPEDADRELKEQGYVNMERGADGILRPLKDSTLLEFWEYTAEPIDENAESCYAVHAISGHTPRGYTKSTFITSEVFDVNR